MGINGSSCSHQRDLPACSTVWTCTPKGLQRFFAFGDGACPKSIAQRKSGRLKACQEAPLPKIVKLVGPLAPQKASVTALTCNRELNGVFHAVFSYSGCPLTTISGIPPPPGLRSDSGERLFEVGDQIVGILDADRDAHQIVGDPERLFAGIGH